jgi:protease-4
MGTNEKKDIESIYADIIRGYQDEHRKTRIWGTAFKFGVLAYMFFILISGFYVSGMAGETDISEDHIGVVDIFGVIDRESGVNAYSTMKSLQDAFGNENAKAIVLNADSPGGSPVQSDLIHGEIYRLRALYPEKSVYAVIGDICGSGCYYIVAAADKIIVNRNSMVGSIGVKSEGFGYTGLMDKLGVERRSIAVGDHKTMMDPYQPIDEFAVNHFRSHILEVTGKNFKQVIETGRDRNDFGPEVFSGLVWAGEEAIALGLADSIGDVYSVAREVIGKETVYNYSKTKFSMGGLFKSMTSSVLTAIEERSML